MNSGFHELDFYKNKNEDGSIWNEKPKEVDVMELTSRVGDIIKIQR